jgi:RNA polymerase sigma-70 factor (ECF subfamily)
MRDLGEAQLIEHCMRGNEAAWREMVRRFESVVYGVSYRILKDPDEARDATQESLIKALRALDTFETGRRLKPWLAKIAWNHAIRLAAKQHKRLVALDEQGMAGPWSDLPDPAQVAERKEMGEAIEAAMNELPTAMQIVLEMRCAQGMDYRDIAHATGWPIGTVKTNLFRARKRLAERVAEMDGESL